MLHDVPVIRPTRRWRYNPGLSAYLLGPYIETPADLTSLNHMYKRADKIWRDYKRRRGNRPTRQHPQRKHRRS